jgi:metallo-beta-lactamase class B
MRKSRIFTLGVLFLFAAARAEAQATPEEREWNKPVEPFRIAGDLYYVGAAEISSFLIQTPVGLILIDGGFAETAPQIEANIAKLGFKIGDVKILLNGHAHGDHAGGLAELKKRSGAKLFASAADAPLLEDGGRSDFRFGAEGQFPPVAVDRRLADGEEVALGGVELTAHLTPGHTRGCTTWTFQMGELPVVVACSASVLDYRLAGKESYPGIAADFERSFGVWRSLPASVFLAQHGWDFDLASKRERATRGMGPRNPFVDPAGYKAWIEEKEAAFRKALAEQREAEKAPAATKVQ